MSQSDDKPSIAVINAAKSPTPQLNGFDYFANQNGGQFDPTLFGEYRDTQNAIIGDGDFTGGFFNDAFLNAGYGSPFHFGDTPAVQKPNPLEEIERIQDGEDEVVPGEDINSMLNCHKIWLVTLLSFKVSCTLIGSQGQAFKPTRLQGRNHRYRQSLFRASRKGALLRERCGG